MRIIFFWLVLNVSFKGFSQNLEPLKTSSTILEKPLNVDGFNSRYGIKKNKLIQLIGRLTGNKQYIEQKCVIITFSIGLHTLTFTFIFFHV